MRKTKFYDIPVHEKTREKLRKAKKKKNLNSYDSLINNILKDVMDFDVGGNIL
jgi:hypothetical protein